MVLRIQEFPVISQSIPDLIFHVQLVFDPQRCRFQKRDEPPRCNTDVGLQDPLELEKRLVVEADVVEIRRGDSCGAEAVANRVLWKGGVAFLTCEAFLLGGGHDLTVGHQACRAVVIKGRDTEDIGCRALH